MPTALWLRLLSAGVSTHFCRVVRGSAVQGPRDSVTMAVVVLAPLTR
jgi:hypothetical protein